MPITTFDLRDADDATSGGQTDQRMPSRRPLDHRWDHSRGISFNTARSGNDLPRTPSRGLAFSTHARVHGARPLGARAKLPRPTAPDQSPTKAWFGNPYETPQLLEDAQLGKMEKLNEQIAEAKKERIGLEAKLEESRSRFAQLEQQQRSHNKSLKQQASEYEAAMSDVRKTAEASIAAMKERLGQIQGQVRAEVAGKDAEMQERTLRHKDAIAKEQQRSEEKLAVERQALEQKQ
ncbi:hypothetical protein LTR53_017597, partial [Teratosphaeriaceae sp. CCFEE 6253]